MILLIRDNNEVLQMTNVDEDTFIEEEHRRGSQIYRFDPCFFKYQRYVGGGKWEYLPFSRPETEADD